MRSETRIKQQAKSTLVRTGSDCSVSSLILLFISIYSAVCLAAALIVLCQMLTVFDVLPLSSCHMMV